MCGIVHTFHAFILSIPCAKTKSVIINNHDALQIFIEEQLPDRKRTIVVFFPPLCSCLADKIWSAHTCVRFSSMPFHWNVYNLFWIINCLKCNYLILCAMERFFIIIVIIWFVIVRMTSSCEDQRIAYLSRMLHIYLCITLVQQVILIWHDMFNEYKTHDKQMQWHWCEMQAEWKIENASKKLA